MEELSHISQLAFIVADSAPAPLITPCFAPRTLAHIHTIAHTTQRVRGFGGQLAAVHCRHGGGGVCPLPEDHQP